MHGQQNIKRLDGILSRRQQYSLLVFNFVFQNSLLIYRVRSGLGGWGTALQAGRSGVRIPMGSVGFIIDYKPSGRTLALESTQPLIETSTRVIS